MRRTVLLLLFLLGGLLAATAVIFAHEQRHNALPQVWLDSNEQMAMLALEEVAFQSSTLSPQADDPADACEEAPQITTPDGISFDVNNETSDITDPTLNCLWGNPSSDKGYRTVWYRFVAPQHGQVIIDTQTSNYDTVVAIFTGTCGAFTQVGCNDDSQGLTSRVSFAVSEGETYYIEVADWQAGSPGSNLLNLVATMLPIQTKWQLEANMPLPRTRHATAVVGNDIYVFGGQSDLNTPPTILRDSYRFETDTGNWVPLADLPGAAGYANTTAAYANGSIYLPAGFDGNSAQYNGTHWRYHISGNFWSMAATAPWPNNEPLAWGTAVSSPIANGYYHLGGISNSPFLTSTLTANAVFFYDADTNQWLPKSPLLSPRYAHTGVWLNNLICVAGGLNANVLLTNAECFDPTGGGSAFLTSNMNHPRYGAASAVGPDGNWYVFGGADGQGAVSEVEYYDFDTDTWIELNINFDLGGTQSNPARSWPRGQLVGDYFWAIGGHTLDSGSLPPSGNALSIVERLFLPTQTLYLPFVSHSNDDSPDDNFTSARRLQLNIAQQHNFSDQDDYYDTFFFDLSVRTFVKIGLTQIPASSNYDFGVYDSDKLLWGQGDNPGAGVDEALNITLDPGRYYILIERVLPNAGTPDTSNYRIIVEN